MSVYAAVMWAALLVCAFGFAWILWDALVGWFAAGSDLVDELADDEFVDAWWRS